MDNFEDKDKSNRHYEQNNDRPFNNPNASKWFGLFIIIIGFFILLKNIPQTASILPHWLFTWPMILIVVGIYSLIKHRNKNPLSWLIPILVGVYFLLRTNILISVNTDRFLLPAVFIVVGIVLFFKRNNSKYTSKRNNFQELELVERNENSNQTNTEDFITINTTLGNAKKIILSKKFKGGTINCSFGSAEIDLTQADIQGAIVLNFSIIAGGAELLVPSNWEIQNNVNVVLGSIEDKRRRFNHSDEQRKVLILEGNLSLGGLEIKN